MASAPPADTLSAILDDAKMSAQQIGVVMLAVCLAAMDGYDIQMIAFVSPAISAEWGVDRGALGFLLASGLFGMAIGALTLSPLADIFGRRPMALFALATMSAGAFASAIAPDIPLLTASRIVTGVGVGTMVSLTTTIAAEFSNTKRRSLAVAATTVGFTVGGAIAGLTATAVLTHLSWHWVFVSGGALGITLFLVCLVLLPESPTFLAARGRADALQRINAILARLKCAPISALPPTREGAKRSSLRALFAPNMIATTIRYTAVTVLIVTAAYYLLSWLPQLVADAGYPPAVASFIATTGGLVGIVSGLLFGALATRISAPLLAGIAMICFGLALIALGYAPPTQAALIFVSSVCGFFLSGATATLYTSMAAAFPAQMRVSGLGFAGGLGRLLSGAGPAAAGLMFAAGLTRDFVSIAFAAMAIIAGLLVASAPSKRERPSLASV